MSDDSSTRAVRAVFGRYVPASKVEALRLKLIRAGLIEEVRQCRHK